jgi:hypothetical protein
MSEALRDGPAALYQLFALRLKNRPGYDLLTVLAPNEGGDRLVRWYSSDLGRYPLGDADVVRDNKWFRRLFLDLQPVIANGATAIADWLPDFLDPATPHFSALINMPIVIAGATLGLANLTRRAGAFAAGDVIAISDESSLAALAILATGRARRTFEVRSTIFSSLPPA